MSLVKKMYGKSVLAEEVNKLLSDSVYKYIQDNKVNILGEPLPNEDKQKDIDFDTMEEFEFFFDVAWLRNSRLRFLLMIRWITIQLV